MIKITKLEGISALWKGLVPTLVMAVPATVVYYVGYERIRESLEISTGAHFLAPMIAGSTARLITTFVISPLELLRTRVQVSKNNFGVVTQGLKTLIKEKGILTLWKGIGPTLLRDVPFSAVYWMLFEAFKKEIKLESEIATNFLSGATAGSVAAIVTHPFDVFKTLQQVTNSNATTTELVGLVVRAHGLRGLFLGLVPRIVKIAPAAGVMIATYEFGKRF